MISLHISPVGRGPGYNQLKNWNNLIVSQTILKEQYVTGPGPIPALTCSDMPEPGLPSIHSYSYEFQSSPTFSHICPASASGILVIYAD
jgi:hypothetical protein